MSTDAIDKIIELGKMAKWYRANRTRLRMVRQDDAEQLFNSIVNPLYIDALGQVLRTWLIESEAIDRSKNKLTGEPLPSGATDTP